MFDTKSDYALNKKEQDAIVCKSLDGVHIRLTREDFASEEEFLRWKAWSDGDDHDTEKAGRDFYDNGLPLDAGMDAGSVPSSETVFFGTMEDAEAETEQMKKAIRLITQLKAGLTETQYRRLWMYYVQGMTVEEISVAEGTAHQNVSKSIRAAWKKIKKIFHLCG